MKNVLVVCTGNICRSPFGAAYLESELGGSALVRSAGTCASPDAPADPMAIKVATGFGLDISCHRSRRASAEMLKSADLVLTMEAAQRTELSKLAPWATGKIWRLGHHFGIDVVDPFERPEEMFSISFQTIIKLSQSWLALLKES